MSDEARDAAYAEADKVEQSFNNPLEEAAKKAAADAMRRKADEADAAARSKADQAELSAIMVAQAQADSACGVKRQD